jgi:deazaflavin-dependent oxidoreductase (nitroreductase family)
VDEGGDDLTVFHEPVLLAGERTCGRYRSGIDEAFCYLTTTGRRSGRPHRIEIWFGTGPGPGRTIYVLAGGRDRADWVRNLMAEPHVQVQVGDTGGEATARVLQEGTDEDALARRLLLAKYQRPGKDDLVDWGRTALPVALDLAF